MSEHRVYWLRKGGREFVCGTQETADWYVKRGWTLMGEYVRADDHQGTVAHVEEAVTIAIVMLAGIGDVWAELDYPERCARAENELRALLDHLGGQ